MICQGCGAKIQTQNPALPGYLPDEILKKRDKYYCKRCYNLIHYKKKLDVKFSQEEFLQNLEKLAKRNVLIVKVVDIFDIDGTLIPHFSKIFSKNKVLIVGNKFDLFLDSVKRKKVHDYFRNYLSHKNISYTETVLISSFKASDLDILLDEIFRLKEEDDIAFVGTTNVGKSSIINGIIRKLKLKQEPLTISSATSTTLGLVEIKLPDSSLLIDTPGLLNKSQASYYLDYKNQELLLPKKYLKPRIYQLLPEQTLFIGGFCRVDFVSGKSSSFIVNIANSLNVHRSKLSLADQFYNLHKDDILKIPNEEERKRLGRIKKYNFSFGNQKKDLFISGLGFITLVGEGELEVYTFEKIGIGLREAII